MIHVRRGELLTAAGLEEAKARERDEHVDMLAAGNDRMLMRLMEMRRDNGLDYGVQILACGELSCPACQDLDGRRLTLDEALELRPLPCPECTTTLHNGWENVCRCTYVAITLLPGQRL